MTRLVLFLALLCAMPASLFAIPASLCATLSAQETHDHPVPEKLGTVSFRTSCQAGTQAEFNRAVALLHSFAYSAAEAAFRSVAETDPQCAMAHWGIAMTHYHQLWDPPLPTSAISIGEAEIRREQVLGAEADTE